MISISSHSRFSERLNRIYLISYQVIVILQLYFLTWYRFWGGFLNWEKFKRKWRVVQYHYCWVAWCVPPFSIYSFPALFRYVIGRSSWTRSRSVKHSKACVDARRARELFIIPPVLMTHWGNRVCVCVCDGKVFCQKTLWSVLCYSVEGGHR